METIVFAGISLILLIPIVYVLPLSLTFKGKLVIIGGAVAVALAGLVVANIYPLWQALLFLSLLLCLALFFIGKKIDPLMLSTQAEAGPDFYERFDGTTTLSESTSERVSLSEMEESKEESIEKVVFETSEHHVAASEEYTQEMEKQEQSVDNEIVIIDAKMETRTGALDETESLPETEIPVKSEISEIERLLEDDFVEPVMEETESLPEIEIPVKRNLSEIERLLEDDFVEPVMEETESLPEIEIPVKSEISEIERLLEDDFVEPVMDETESLPEIEVPVKSDISEIEKLLEDDYLELVIEEEEKYPNSQPATLEEEDNPVHLEDVGERILPLGMEELDVFPEEHEWEAGINESEKVTESIEVNTTEEQEDGFLKSGREGGDPEEPVTLEDISDETGREDNLEVNIEEQNTENIQLEDSLETESLLEIPELLIPEKDSTHSLESLERDKAIDEPEQEPESEGLLEESSTIIEQSKETSLESSSSDVEQIPPISEEITTATEHVSELQQQMFQTMVSHIQIAQQQLNDSEFEQLVMSHLHPDIPDQQYYIFASFLIQKYMTAKKTEKLRELISQLKEKFSTHPILLQELEFMERRFC